MKWIFEHITPAALVVIVGILLGAILTAYLTPAGPVKDFAATMMTKVTNM